MTLFLDAGAFIALARGDSHVHGLLRIEREVGGIPVTHGGIVAQVWRDARRQVVLGRALRSTRILPLTAAVGRDAGLLLASSGTSDVIDAALVSLADDGDEIITSDPGDLSRLIDAHGANVGLIVV